MMGTARQMTFRTGVLGLAAVLAAVAVAPVAAAGEEAERLCPDEMPAIQYFADIHAPHTEAINCFAYHGIVEGTRTGPFRPASSIAREQLASVLDRLIEVVREGTPTASGREFTDLRGGVHDDAIRRMGQQGYVTGYADGTYRPHQAVTRGQLATIAVRAHEILAGSLPEGDRNTFPDTAGSPHADAIAAAHEAGLVRGYDDGTFGPGDPVLRGQTASVLHRLGDLVTAAREKRP